MSVVRVAARVARWLVSAVLIALFAVMVLRMCGVLTLYSVQSGSMFPTVPVGALVVSTPTDAADVRVGDVVTVDDGSGRVTHRVVASEHSDQLAPMYRLLTLKGDNNKVEDPQPYLVDHVDTLRVSVPGVGSAIDWLDQGFNRVAVIAGITGAVLLISGLKARGRRREETGRTVARSGEGGVHAAQKVSA